MTSMRLIASLAAALTLSGAIGAQQQDRPTFRSGTRLIEIGVIVTDKDRNPVHGLTANNFQIFEDGQPQKVEFFSVESATVPRPAQKAVAPATREFSNHAPVEGGVTVILFDRLNTPDSDQMYARGHVAKFLEQIRPEDRVGLYVLDGSGFRVIHDFTNDSAALVHAMSRVRSMTSAELAATLDVENWLEIELATLFAMDYEDVRAGLRNMNEHFMGVRAVSTIDTLEMVARHLAGVRGRKNLVWVSSGFPLSAFNYRGRTQTTEISRATRALNDANVAIYTVDARGLIGALLGPPRGGKPVFTTLSSVTTNQDILQSVAEQTGARAFLNTNDITGAVRRAVDDGRSTYVLGYYPSIDRGDGRFHQVRVKVNRRGVDVRHRQGYFAFATQKQAESQRSASLLSAIMSPFDASGLGLTVRVDPVAGKPSEARLTVRLDPGTVALERHSDRWAGAIDVIVAQVRADGTSVRSSDNTVDITLSDERLEQISRDGVAVVATVAVLPDAERLRIVVRDVRTGNLGTVGIPAKQVRAIVH
jgi:VWFA-related protein